MNTNDDRNLIISKYVKLVTLLKVDANIRTEEQKEELVKLEKEIENLKVKFSKQPTKNQFNS